MPPYLIAHIDILALSQPMHSPRSAHIACLYCDAAFPVEFQCRTHHVADNRFLRHLSLRSTPSFIITRFTNQRVRSNWRRWLPR
jgi:hypothetical protein